MGDTRFGDGGPGVAASGGLLYVEVALDLADVGHPVHLCQEEQGLGVVT